MFDLSLVQPLDVLDWFKKFGYLKDLFVKFGDVSHAELAINIFDAIIAIAVLFFQAIVRVVDFFLANQMARSDIATIHQENANEQDSQRIMCYVREALRLRPLVSLSSCLSTILINTSCSLLVSRTAVVPVPAYDVKLEDWVFVDIVKANVC